MQRLGSCKPLPCSLGLIATGSEYRRGCRCVQAMPGQAAAKVAAEADAAAAAKAAQEAREQRLWAAYSLAGYAYISAPF